MLILSRKAKYLLTLLTGAILFLASASSLHAVSLKGFKPDDLKKIQADNWDIDGKNIVVKGNVCLPGENSAIYADTAIINTESKDFEAIGNVRFYSWSETTQTLTPDKLAELEKQNNQTVEITKVSGNLWEAPSITVKTRNISNNIIAGRLAGNLDSGYFAFENAQLNFNNFICKAGFGERRADGVIQVRDTELSPCSYLEGNNAHFSISAGEATFTPYKTEFYGTKSVVTAPSDHTIMLTNGIVRIYGVPVLWLPVFYKPKDEEPGLFGSQYGRSGNWGHYINTYRYFHFNDYPYTRIKVMADFYTNRGFGYGTDTDIATKNSKTNFFAYAIYDHGRFRSDDYYDYNIKIPRYRYNFRLSNVTHITPRLDFRGVFELNSDPYIVKDFFESRYNPDPRPATFAALEQQFDHLSAYLYVHPKINSFYTETEHLPSFGLEVPRQEIFDTNLYYQGDFKTGYLKMDWTEFDEDIKNSDKLRNYDTWRLDTTHFLYYPLQLDWLTIVPRAGIKLTAYSHTSDRKVTQADHIAQYHAANLENDQPYRFNTYDNKGGSKLRVAGELGVEASTKIHRTWNDVKSTLFQIDGLRHVMRPYINYTYIPKPSVNRDKLFYFDDIDRLTEQNFVRLGLENRLQTRDGNSLRTLFYMENYWDIYMKKEDGFDRIGNFCTNLQFSPLKNLSIGTSFSLDLSHDREKAPDVLRDGREAGTPGIDWKWLNSWSLNVTYSPVEDIKLTLAYTVNRPYSSRPAYSMGSNLTQYEAGRLFDKYYDDYSQEISLTLSTPLTPDRRTWMQYEFVYDIYMGCIDSQSLQLIRQFHCVSLVLACSLERDKDAWKNFEFDYSISLVFNGLSPMASANSSLVKANED